MPTGPTCSNCGRVNRPNAKMCAGCGKPLAAQPPAPTPPPPPKPVPQPPAAPRQPPMPPPPRQPAQPAPKARRRAWIAWWQVLIVVVVLALCACGAIAFLLRDRISRVLAPPSPTMMLPVTTPTPFGVLPPPLSTSTIAAPTSAPIPPSTTPVPLTATPTITPTAAFVPDTPPSATLKPGETWRQNNMMLTLQRQKFAEVSCGGFLEFDLTLENFEPNELVVNWRGDDVAVKNDQDIPYPQTLFQPSPATTDCARYIPLPGASFLPALGGRKTFGITVQARGQLDDKVNKIFVVVAKAGRVQNAKWEITVPR